MVPSYVRTQMEAAANFCKILEFAQNIRSDCHFDLTMTTDIGDVITFRVRNYIDWLREVSVLDDPILDTIPRDIQGSYNITRGDATLYNMQFDNVKDARSIFEMAVIPWINTIAKNNIHLDTDLSDTSDDLLMASNGADIVWDIWCNLLDLAKPTTSFYIHQYQHYHHYNNYQNQNDYQNMNMIVF